MRDCGAAGGRSSEDRRGSRPRSATPPPAAIFLCAPPRTPVPGGDGAWLRPASCRRASDLPRKPPCGSSTRRRTRSPCARDAPGPSTTNGSLLADSCSLRFAVENAAHDLRHPVPVVGFSLESPLSRRAELVELGLALIVGLTPLAFYQSLMLQPIQRRIQRALLDLKLIAGNLLYTQQHSVPMQRPQGYRLQNEHVERALQKFKLLDQDGPSQIV